MSDLGKMYIDECLSITQISDATGIPQSNVRNWLLKGGVQLRTRTEGIRLSTERISRKMKGRRLEFTQEWKDNIRRGKLKYGAENARGTSIKPNGYIEITRGENKGKSIHRAIMEEHIGRKLQTSEIVHHKNGNKQDNNLDNLEILSRSKHASIHATLNHKNRERDKYGRFI